MQYELMILVCLCVNLVTKPFEKTRNNKLDILCVTDTTKRPINSLATPQHNHF